MRKDRASVLLSIAFIVALAFSLILTRSVVAWEPADSSEGAARATELTDIQIFYKLDPLLTGGLFFGERWVSPPLYDIVTPQGAPYTLTARVEGIDGDGRRELIQAEWTAADGEMLTIMPGEDYEALITVHRAGASNLQVSAGGVSKSLFVEAAGVDCTALRLRVWKQEPAETLAQELTCIVHLPSVVLPASASPRTAPSQDIRQFARTPLMPR